MNLHPDIERLGLLGWRLCPSSRSTRATCIARAADLATCDLDQLERWSREFTGCNWRVVMKGSGIWALDVDVPSEDHDEDGMKALSDLVDVHGPLPLRPTIRTGGGGCVLFFKHVGEPIVGRTGTPAPGLDPRSGRQTVTLPPSIHHRTRKPYRWLMPPWEVASPPAPEWLLRLVEQPAAPSMHDRAPRVPEGRGARLRYAQAALRNAANRVAGAGPGTRNDALNRETFAMVRFIAEGSLEAIEVATMMAYAARQSGLLPPEVKATVTSALAAGMRR